MKKLTFLKTIFLAVVLMAGSLSAFAQTWTKIASHTDVTETDTYLIVETTKKVALTSINGASSAPSAVSISDFLSPDGNSITGNISDDLKWTFEKSETSYIIHPNGDATKWLYSTNKNNGIRVGTNENKTFELNITDGKNYKGIKNISTKRFVGVYLMQDWRSYTSVHANIAQSNIEFFKLESSTDTEPTLTATPTSLDFGEVNIGETATQEVTVTGSNLTAAPTHTVSGTGFTVAGELTAEGGTLTVTYAPTAEGASTGTLTIEGDEQTATVDLSGTGVTPPLAAPVANNVADTDKTITSFTASWSAVEGATSYNVYVYTKAEGSDTPDEGGINETFTWEGGKGGHDGSWGGINSPNLSDTDLPGWTFEKAYKGDNCIKMGSSNNKGVLTTPAIGITGDAVLTFRAGAWDSSTEKTELVLEIAGGGKLDKSSVEMTKGAFSDYTVNITGATAATQITFMGFQSSNSRFFLDDVKIVAASAPAPAPRQKAARPYRVNPATDEQIAGSPFNTTETSYNVTGLDKSQEYYYSVTAVRDEEESAYSNEIGPISLAVTGLSKATLTDAAAWTANGKVMLNATAGEVIEVYNVAGQKVVSRLAADGLNEVAVQLRGVAIVKVGNRISKVVL